MTGHPPRESEIVPGPRRPARASGAGITLLVLACLSIGCWWAAPVVLVLTHGSVTRAPKRGRARDGAMVAAHRISLVVCIFLAATMAYLGGLAFFSGLSR